MSDLPPFIGDRRSSDSEHLKILAIFHFVLAGLCFLGLAFLGLHYVLMHTVMTKATFENNGHMQGPSPEAFFAIFRWFYVIFGTFTLAASLMNFLSAIFIGRQVNRTFSIVVGGLDCFMVPFGTALGVFTLVVLLRDSVRQAYEAASGPA